MPQPLKRFDSYVRLAELKDLLAVSERAGGGGAVASGECRAVPTEHDSLVVDSAGQAPLHRPGTPT